MEKDAALLDFDRARGEFLAALEPVPDAALSYLRAGDIYAIGGLVVHSNWVLRHYQRVLAHLATDAGVEFRTDDPEAEVADANRRAKLGLLPSDRRPELAVLEALHAKVATVAASIPSGDWETKTPVLYGDAADPYPTSPDDVIGWLRDHYREHVPHAADLLAEWLAAQETPPA